MSTLARTDYPTLAAVSAPGPRTPGSASALAIMDGRLSRLDLIPRDTLLTDMRYLVKLFAETVKVSKSLSARHSSVMSQLVRWITMPVDSTKAPGGGSGT
jgi:hypothetical protein